MKLYRITLSGTFEHIPSAWVLANDPKEAEEIITSALAKADYGFYSNRYVKNIELIAQDDLYSYGGVLFQKDHIVKNLEPKK